MAREFQGHLDGALKDSGFDEVKKEIDNIRIRYESDREELLNVKYLFYFRALKL